MKRRVYVQIPVILIGGIIMGILGLAVWSVCLIPVMIRPSLTQRVKIGQRITAEISKRMVQSAMRSAMKAGKAA